MEKVTEFIKKLYVKRLLGRRFVKCRVCGKETEISVILGDICSMECLTKEKDERFKDALLSPR